MPGSLHSIELPTLEFLLPAHLQRKLELPRIVSRRRLARETRRSRTWIADLVNGGDVGAIEQIEAVGHQIQLEAFESIPFMPVGGWYYPWALRKDLTDLVQCAAVLFWGVRRA